MEPAAPTSRILVIEDDRTWQAMVERLVRAREPLAECLVAGDLASALPLLGTPGLDLVLLDLNLPDSRGLETLRQVRRENRRTAVVVMTAETDEELALQALRSGAQDYLMKEHWSPATLQRIFRYARERMASELRLRRSEELFLTISENMVDLLAIVDAHGRRFFTSPSYARVLGYSMAEIERIPMAEAVHPDDLPRVGAALKELFTQGLSQSLEYRLRHQDGSYRLLESRATRFEGVGGEGYQALVVARDVTERSQAERERARLEAQLLQAQKLESVGRLASGIAHEINTPIQFVTVNLAFLKKAFLQLTAQLGRYRSVSAELDRDTAARLLQAEQEADLDYLQAELPKVLQDSQEGVQRVAGIVRAMKEFTHPGNRETSLLDLNRLARSAATVTGNEWKYVAGLELDLEDNIPMINGYAAELNQVLVNLIVNAAQAIAARKSASPGTITVTTRSLGEQVELRVRDTGTGIREEHQAKLFEPFFTTKEVGQGTGQGLAICYQTVVKQHRGKIYFETLPGAGTTFIIQLPAASKAMPPEG